METLLTVFIIVTAVAIVIQMAVLVALYASVKKTGERVQTLATQLEQQGLPTLQMARELLAENGPKIKAMVENANVTIANVREQVHRLDASVTDIVDRTRLQVIRADELVTRTIDAVEETTDLVQHTVISPVRAVAGVLQGITVGAGALLGTFRRRPRPRRGTREEEEMFI